MLAHSVLHLGAPPSAINTQLLSLCSLLSSRGTSAQTTHSMARAVSTAALGATQRWPGLLLPCDGPRGMQQGIWMMHAEAGTAYR